ncbi:hypothetical protein [Aliiglaciecola sp. M165]|uniref:hypothetical protein n=1 Tax=Aliiglaciecola sp. M165 TaxID=2593649 RepID=UPI00117D513B|nr:hypothetical protein [Aliiglaciecola sp. M165]TRY32523.1 hypothetical protein FM019_06715 [Aliiglaciecola sp. M165]
MTELDSKLLIDANAIIRHYSSLRFAIMTVLIAASGGLFTVYVNLYNKPISTLIFLIPFIGLILSIVFFVNERRIRGVQKHFIEVAENIEKANGLRGWNDRPAPPGHHRIGNASVVFYYANFATWLAVLYDLIKL